MNNNKSSNVSSRFISHNQSGLVSFMVTMILMMVITLIMVGFTQLTIRSREDTLDKQLSTQAMYAAETGVNDVVKGLRGLYAANAANANYTPPSKTTCNGVSPYDPVAPATKSLANGVSYTCTLVTPNSKWVQTSADVNGSKVIPIEAVDNNGSPVPVWSLKFEWKPTVLGTKNDCPADANTYPSNWGTCPYGLLRVDLYRVGAIAAVNPADTLRDATYTIYLMPMSGAGWLTDISNPGGDRAFKGPTNCTDTSCVGQIDIHEPVGTANKYFARISSVYLDIPSITLTGKMNDAWVYPEFSFKGQSRVDVTGKAQDVLRRIQVQVSSDGFGSDLIPNATAHSSGTICKRFIAAPNYYEDQCAEDTAN